MIYVIMHPIYDEFDGHFLEDVVPMVYSKKEAVAKQLAERIGGHVAEVIGLEDLDENKETEVE